MGRAEVAIETSAIPVDAGSSQSDDFSFSLRLIGSCVARKASLAIDTRFVFLKQLSEAGARSPPEVA